MQQRRTTFSKFIIENERRRAQPDPDLTALLNDIQTACKFIASAVSRGALDASTPSATDIMLRECEWGGKLCGIASTESHDAPYAIPADYPRGRYLLAFDALDGSGNLDVDVAVGTIFSVLRAPDGVTHPTAEHFLQPGSEQVPVVDDRHHARRGRPRVHARPGDRSVHADQCRHAHSDRNARVRDQRLERTRVGAARPALH
jgi:fructose-1,6-bisphosphatase I